MSTVNLFRVATLALALAAPLGSAVAGETYSYDKDLWPALQHSHVQAQKAPGIYDSQDRYLNPETGTTIPGAPVGGE